MKKFIAVILFIVIFAGCAADDIILPEEIIDDITVEPSSSGTTIKPNSTTTTPKQQTSESTATTPASSETTANSGTATTTAQAATTAKPVAGTAPIVTNAVTGAVTNIPKPANKNDYNKVYKLVKDMYTEQVKYSGYNDIEFDDGVASVSDSLMMNSGAPVPGAAAGVMTDSAVPMEAEREAAPKSDEYSETNNQVAGIQEGDIIKTDGKNIYLSSNYTQSVSVVKADNGSMTRTAKLTRANARPVEMLLYNNKLIIIWNVEKYINTNGGDYVRNIWYGFWEQETIVDVYDISGSFNNPSATYSQDGWYVSSRMIDNHIYLITNHSPYMYDGSITEEEYDRYIPSYKVNGGSQFVPANCIILPEKIDYVTYTIVAGLNINNASLLVSVQANLGGSHIIYSSHNNIYLTMSNYEQAGNYYEETATIHRLSINAGQVNYAATGKVKGRIDTQFYLDEHNGILRVVTQVWGNGRNNRWGSQGGSLYTMDKDLNILCETHGIGGDEAVQSVRFDGDIGYIVTFMLTDPLFSFDLSNPYVHKKLDELKIPGFSRYMHKWSDGLLLGVGVDADEITGRRTGLKLSMFDIADNENLSEKHVYIINEKNNNSSWSWYSTPAEYEHKAILVSPEKNIIAFPYTYSGHNDYIVAYVIFSYDEKTGFKLMGEMRDEISYYNNYNDGEYQRGLFIGDYLYATTDRIIVSMSLNTYEIVESLKLN